MVKKGAENSAMDAGAMDAGVWRIVPWMRVCGE